MLSSKASQTGQQRWPATRIPTICVVDSQAADYQGWDDSAATYGAQLRIVASAAEALRFSRTAAVDLWVVNTDLPGLSGFELCSMLKSRNGSTPVYLVADEYRPDLERAAWSAKATLFGPKPGHHAWLQEWIAHASHSLPVADCGNLRAQSH